ncbi:MAG TPA: hypothetical protein VGU68_15095 [Ktedonobacteraceae bacterium]|nr:hypothetical protein [Ktedonobacteraceae bacterium]HEV2661934.1 hypothetical protein [Ktedonobacteraceae bacterium]
MEQDFLDEMIEESTKKNPEFPSLIEEARQRRLLQAANVLAYEKRNPSGAFPMSKDEDKPHPY